MKPPIGTNEGDPQGAPLDGACSARSSSEAAVNTARGAVASPDECDLGAWLDALEPGEPEPLPLAGQPSWRSLCEAEELSMVLEEVVRERRGHESAPAQMTGRRSAPRGATPSPRFDARTLAERLLAESQQHAILEAEPADLLAAQLGTDALSEELLARLLEGIVSGPFGSDEFAARGPTERGLLALLALQLYVHEARSRVRRNEPEAVPPPTPEPAVVRDARLLETLAVPHAASRPLGERRPRGRPRR